MDNYFDERSDSSAYEADMYSGEGTTLVERYLSDLLRRSTVRDADSAARDLIRAYGSLDVIATRDVDELSRAVGESAAILIKLVAYVTARRVYDEFRFGRRHSDSEIIELLRFMMAGLSHETVYMLSIDSRGAVVACDVIGEGTVNSSDIYPRKLVEYALKRGAASVFLAHNHPNGTTEPSGDDMLATARVFSTLRASGIRLRAHAVVANTNIRLMIPNDKTGEIEVSDTL